MKDVTLDKMKSMRSVSALSGQGLATGMGLGALSGGALQSSNDGLSSLFNMNKNGDTLSNSSDADLINSNQDYLNAR